MIRALALPFVATAVLLAVDPTRADEPSPLPPAAVRFADAETTEAPDFQRHVLPLMGRLGCNSRSCHGSFQGQGGFQLSLFGYDFQADHKSLLAPNEGRVDPESPESSLILQKPSGQTPHKGGTLLAEGDWSYNLLRRWVEAGAEAVQSGAPTFVRLEVAPASISFNADGQTQTLRVIAHWSDGSTEDVTPLARFQTNDESIASISPEGRVASTGKGDTHIVVFYDNGVLPVPVVRAVTELTGDAYPAIDTPTEIDRLVVDRLRPLGIVPSETCTDAEFLRRVSLDLTGTLPTPEEIRAFLADSTPEKRALAIERLLETPAYSAYWANRLGDYLGNTPQQFQNMPGAANMSRLWYEWMQQRLAANTPYDEIVSGIVLAASRRQTGQSYADYVQAEARARRDPASVDPLDQDSMPYFWARRNLRQPDEKALAFSYAFLGVRLECAQCHKHPYDQWTQEDFNQFRAFFQPIRYGLPPEGNRLLRAIRTELEAPDEPQEPPKPVNGGELRREVARRLQAGQPVPVEELIIQTLAAPRRARPAAAARRPQNRNAGRVPSASVLGGERVDLSQADDPRQPLMDWMRSADNPYFAQALVNRVWAAHFGRGLIDPPDDANLANPPSNAPLLEWLTRQFIAQGYDLKWLHRTILVSDTYQRSWRPNETNRLDDRHFSHSIVRRLPAESLLDAIRQATASDSLRKRFAANMELRSFGPAGRPANARGGADYAARLFGRSSRDTNCDCSRSDAPNLLQSIYLQNDNELHAAINRPDGWVSQLIAQTSRNGKTSRAASASRPNQDLEEAIAALEKRLSRLPDSPDSQERRARLTQNLHRLRQRAARAADKGTPQSVESPIPLQPARLIDEAYLRTLSRPPTTDEAAIAGQHFEQAESTAEALRDLLWVLLNTKEFATNH